MAAIAILTPIALAAACWLLLWVAQTLSAASDHKLVQAAAMLVLLVLLVLVLALVFTVIAFPFWLGAILWAATLDWRDRRDAKDQD